MLRLFKNTYDDLIDLTNAKYVIYYRRIESSQKIPNDEMKDPQRKILPKSVKRYRQSWNSLNLRYWQRRIWEVSNRPQDAR